MISRQQRLRGGLWAAVALGVLAALFALHHRWNAERDNLRVEIAIDLNEVRAISAAEALDAQGGVLPLSKVLGDFADAGVSSVSVEEDTIGSLEQSHRLTIIPLDDRNTTVIQPLSIETFNRIALALQYKTGFVSTSRPPGNIAPPFSPTNPALAPGVIIVKRPVAQVRTVGLGLDPDIVKMVLSVQSAQKARLHVLARVGNYANSTPAGIDYTLQALAATHASGGSTTVIFTGDEVLGYAGPMRGSTPAPNIKFVAEEFAKYGLNYGTVEFGKQAGDLDLQRKAQANTVRVHTILGTEMATAEIPGNVQRFLLAARERNIRVLFVRMFLSEPNPIEVNKDYIHQIAYGLTHARPTKLQTGVAHGYSDLATARWLRALIGLGVASGLLLLFDAITLGLEPGAVSRFFLGVVCVIALALVVLPAVNIMGAKIVALAEGCIFPSLALLNKDRIRSESGSGLSPEVTALVRLGECVAITAIGIVLMVGLLVDRSFLIKTDEFLGVKAVSIVPTLLVALVYGLSLRASTRRSWSDAIGDALKSTRQALSEPICLWQVLVGIVALVVVAVVVTRSGNDSVVGVSTFELKLRGVLDLLMPARPRFKDMAGHTALLIGFTLAARGYRQWAFPLLLIGALGLSSMLDAFCHLHTPLLVALVRDLIAVVIALILYALVDPFLRRLKPAPAAV